MANMQIFSKFYTESIEMLSFYILKKKNKKTANFQNWCLTCFPTTTCILHIYFLVNKGTNKITNEI